MSYQIQRQIWRISTVNLTFTRNSRHVFDANMTLMLNGIGQYNICKDSDMEDISMRSLRSADEVSEAERSVVQPILAWKTNELLLIFRSIS